MRLSDSNNSVGSGADSWAAPNIGLIRIDVVITMKPKRFLLVTRSQSEAAIALQKCPKLASIALCNFGSPRKDHSRRVPIKLC